MGLTATPKMDVDRNTYDFFEMENGVPTYVYDCQDIGRGKRSCARSIFYL